MMPISSDIFSLGRFHYKRLLSYLLPIKLYTFKSDSNFTVQIYVDKGQFQMVYNDAIYSFGLLYQPFVIGITNLNLQELKYINNCLVLGAGMGSIPFIFQNYYPRQNIEFTLVEIDSAITGVCKAFLEHCGQANASVLCLDALAYLELCDKSYDLICVDVFENLNIPKQFVSCAFFKRVSECLSSNGKLIYNFIPNEHITTDDFRANIMQHFNVDTCLFYKTNQIYIAQKKAN